MLGGRDTKGMQLEYLVIDIFCLPLRHPSCIPTPPLYPIPAIPHTLIQTPAHPPPTPYMNTNMHAHPHAQTCTFSLFLSFCLFLAVVHRSASIISKLSLFHDWLRKPFRSAPTHVLNIFIISLFTSQIRVIAQRISRFQEED